MADKSDQDEFLSSEQGSEPDDTNQDSKAQDSKGGAFVEVAQKWASQEYNPRKCQDGWTAPPKVALGMAQEQLAYGICKSATGCKVPAGCVPIANVGGVPVLKSTAAYSGLLLLLVFLVMRCCCCGKKKKKSSQRGLNGSPWDTLPDDGGLEMTSVGGNRTVVGGVVQEFTIGDGDDDPFGLDDEDDDHANSLLGQIQDSLGEMEGIGSDSVDAKLLDMDAGDIDWEKIEVV